MSLTSRLNLVASVGSIVAELSEQRGRRVKTKDPVTLSALDHLDRAIAELCTAVSLLVTGEADDPAE